MRFASFHEPGWGILLTLVVACGGSTTRESTGTGGSAGNAGSSGAVGSAGSPGGSAGVGAQGGVSGVGAEGGIAGAGAVGGAVGAGAFGGVAGSGAFGGVSGVGAEGGVAGIGAVGGVGGSGELSCVRSQGRARISVTREGQPTVDCGHLGDGLGMDMPVVLEGRITSNVGDGFVLNTCPVDDPCPSSMAHIGVAIDGRSFSLPVDAFVRVTYQFTQIHACQQALEVSAIPVWGGVQNRFQPSNALLLAVSDGAGTFSGSPYKVERQAIGCRPTTQGCGSVKPDEYALVFTPTAAMGSAVRVGMGESSRIQLGQSDVPNSWVVHNLRSYQTEYCDDYWNFAWFVRYEQPTL